MGGLVAAWTLAQAGGYDVTVYQRGWRLGGKGASGRNAGKHQCIEEHGLHVLMGFYRNAFTVLKSIYDEVGRRPPPPQGAIIPFADAFRGWDDCTFSQRWNGRWDFFSVSFPPHPGTAPWDPPGPPGPFDDVLALVGEATRLLFDLLDKLLLPSLANQLATVANAVRAVTRPAQGLALQISAKALEDLDIAQQLQTLWKIAGPTILARKRLRWLWMAATFVGGNLIGMVRDGLVDPAPDFSRIDHLDYREWMRRNLAGLGCPDDLAWDSPFVQGLYDLAFSQSTTLAAGVTLRVVMKMGLGYRGHVAYKMQSGMGDVVFAPLYLALENQVKFRFFHRVRALHLDASGRRIGSIDVEEQVGLAAPYDPLVSVNGHPCWPNEPKHALLAAAYQNARTANGNVPPFDFERDAPSPFATATRSLVKGTDFDVVVLAIPVGALPGICGELAVDPRFAAMLTLRTVQTQCVQVWLSCPLADLEPAADAPMVISYVRPFNSWVDMSQLLAQEEWPANTVAQVAYFCEDLVPAEAPNSGRTRVAANVRRFLGDPGNGDVLDLWRLFDRAAHEVHRYERANTDASDGYVLSEADATRLRLTPDASGFANLALAGDWVRSELNAGCLEAATMGGLDAARGILAGTVHP
jgi:uncharacterized protein with NAD-binding domain and iron-sulfur cluster